MQNQGQEGKESSKLSEAQWKVVIREVKAAKADGSIKPEPPEEDKKLKINPCLEQLLGQACLSERQSPDAVTELSNTLSLLRILTMMFECNS